MIIETVQSVMPDKSIRELRFVRGANAAQVAQTFEGAEIRQSAAHVRTNGASGAYVAEYVMPHNPIAGDDSEFDAIG